MKFKVTATGDSLALAASNGCTVHISDIAGSLPLIQDPELLKLCCESFEEVGGEGCYRNNDKWEPSSTDMGDISSIIPAVHPSCVGAKGTSHGMDYYIEDPVKACVNSAVLQLVMIRNLLENDAERAKAIKKSFKPVFSTKNEYLQFVRNQTCEKDLVIKNPDGSITIL